MRTASKLVMPDTANTWAVAAGEYPICVGYSDQNLRLAGNVVLGGSKAATPSPCGRLEEARR